MTQAMPWVFATLAALALGAVVVAFWQSVRAALGLADTTDARDEGVRDREADLFARKRALLEGLRELDFDHEAGKLSDEDHREERERLRSELGAVFATIDTAIGPYRAAAEALFDATYAQAETEPATSEASTPETAVATSEAATAAPVAAKPDTSEAPVASAANPARPRCPSCATENEPDARFCKRCATPIPTEAVA